MVAGAAATVKSPHRAARMTAIDRRTALASQARVNQYRASGAYAGGFRGGGGRR
jgi:hypothetical protein